MKIAKALHIDPMQRRDFCSYYLESGWGQVFPTTSKKSMSPQCNCNSELFMRDLGPNYYPRYVPEHKCISTNSCEPPLVCREVKYTIIVWSRKGDEQEDTRIRKPLNHCWTFNELNVTVACQCNWY